MGLKLQCHWSAGCKNPPTQMVDFNDGRSFIYCDSCLEFLPALKVKIPGFTVKVTPLTQGEDSEAELWN